MTLHNPHDALFRAAFESPRHAAGLLRALLPADLLDLVALDSLSLQSGDGRGKQLEEFRTDLLFSADIAGNAGFVCFLFEHQSQSDPDMALRVLGYLTRIWERHRRQHPGEPLPPIVPIVISHDPSGWSAPSDFAQLFSTSAREHGALRAITPSFKYIVDDLSRLSDAELKARAAGSFCTSPSCICRRTSSCRIWRAGVSSACRRWWTTNLISLSLRTGRARC